jgi:hypothetical protein
MFAHHDVDAYEDKKEGVIRTEDVRRAMKCVLAGVILTTSQAYR